MRVRATWRSAKPQGHQVRWVWQTRLFVRQVPSTKGLLFNMPLLSATTTISNHPTPMGNAFAEAYYNYTPGATYPNTDIAIDFTPTGAIEGER